MKFNRDNLMRMINLESRRSMGERLASSLGLFLGGALLGAGVALLVAPKSGADLRKELTENGLGPILHRFDGVAEKNSAADSSPRA